MAAKGSLVRNAASARDLFPDDEVTWKRITADKRISPEEMKELCDSLRADLADLEEALPDECVDRVHRVFSRYEMILCALKYSVDSTSALFEAFRESAKENG